MGKNRAGFLFNQGLVDPDRIFDQDPDRDDFFSIKVWLKNFNQRLLKKIQSKSACKKLNKCTTTPHAGDGTGKLVFNQSLPKIFQSGFD
jgi:hypothetical protein